MAKGKKVSVDDVAGEVIRLRKDLTRLKARCGRCKRQRKAIGFAPADVEGAPLPALAHEQDRDEDELEGRS